MNFLLQEVFDTLDKIDDLEVLNQIDNELRDSSITKIFWEQRTLALNGSTQEERARAKVKCKIIAKKYGASIPVKKSVPKFTTPHGFAGIHISIGAKIGKGCTIYQHAVIGSNTMPDSKNAGFPTIGDNVFIGAGAMIIGNVTIGNNVRIGAGAVVTKDVPDNSVVVMSGLRVIEKDEPLNNKFISASKYKKLIENT